MELHDLFILAIGLAMDAFAVSICKGLSLTKKTIKTTAMIGIFFGGFQAIMPLIGWALASQFQQYIADFDHWIAFGLLLFLGGRMIYAVYKGEEEDCNDEISISELLLLAVATSIDALAVGITLAFLDVQILPAICIIGIVTLLISMMGVGIGRRFGGTLSSKSEFIGGVILIFIGIKILLEHLQIW